MTSEATTTKEQEYKNAKDVFVQGCKDRLFEQLTLSWPCRNATLLEIACASGHFLNAFHGYGFDVSGLVIKEGDMSTIRETLTKYVELRLGVPDHLPFDDDSMDYVALLTPFDASYDLQHALSEAMRVARRGLVLGFMNIWSWHGLSQRAARCIKIVKTASSSERNYPLHSYWHMAKLCKELCPHAQIRSLSTLAGPARFWHPASLWHRVNKHIYHLPFGAFVGMSVSIEQERPLTPMPLKAEEAPLQLSTQSFRKGLFSKLIPQKNRTAKQPMIEQNNTRNC